MTTPKEAVTRAVNLFKQTELLRQAEEFSGEELSLAILQIPGSLMADYVERTTSLLHHMEEPED